MELPDESWQLCLYETPKSQYNPNRCSKTVRATSHKRCRTLAAIGTSTCVIAEFRTTASCPTATRAVPCSFWWSSALPAQFVSTNGIAGYGTDASRGADNQRWDQDRKQQHWCTIGSTNTRTDDANNHQPSHYEWDESYLEYAGQCY